MRASPARYWRERKHHYMLVGTKCNDCGKIFFPPRPACPFCGSRNTSEIQLPHRGKLLSYTVIYKPPEGFEKHAPIIYGLIQLDNGAVIEAQLTDVSPENLRTGMILEAVLRKIREDGEHGIIEYGLKFRPELKIQSPPRQEVH